MKSANAPAKEKFIKVDDLMKHLQSIAPKTPYKNPKEDLAKTDFLLDIFLWVQKNSVDK